MGENIALVMIGSAVAVIVLMLAVWTLSVYRTDASIVDIFWGFGFVVVAWVSFALGDGYDGRKWLITVLATVWGLRLTIHLYRRNWGHGEDKRYQAMRLAHPDNFPLWTLWNVYGVQGCLLYVISLPLMMAQVQGGPDELTPLDYIGAAVWLVGFLFEAVGDWQLERFKANPANEGKVMDRGLWRYTRHPNYFGDAVVWWGLFLVCAARPEMLWTIIGPVIMTFLLTRVSGVTLTERTIDRRRPEYSEYKRRTSSFIPLPPKG